MTRINTTELESIGMQVQLQDKRLRQLRWELEIEPRAIVNFERITSERPYLDKDQAWTLSVREARSQYKKDRKIKAIFKPINK